MDHLTITDQRADCANGERKAIAFTNTISGPSEGWDDVDPDLLASILKECFGTEGDVHEEHDEYNTMNTNNNTTNSNHVAKRDRESKSLPKVGNASAAQRKDQAKLAVAFENTYEAIVAPFLVPAAEGGVSTSPGFSQADNIAALHNGLTDCNAKLLQMEGALQEFHSRILDVCAEIDVIRTEAVGTRAARDGKRSLQRHISALLDLIVIPPDVVHLVLMTPEYQQRGGLGGLGVGVPVSQGGGGPLGGGVLGAAPEELSQQFQLAIRRLHLIIRKRIANQEIVLRRPRHQGRQDGGSGLSRQQDIILKLFRCQAFREMVATTEDLLIFVCMRIRSFLEPKISSLENPRANSVAQQEHVLRGYRQLVRFMQDSAAYLKMTLAIRPTPSETAILQAAANGATVAPSALMVQHKPFIPFRVIKALYDDLRTQYLTVLSRVYTARMGRYLSALTEMELGYQHAEHANAPIQTVASSVVGGLASFFWGSSTPAPPPPSAASTLQGGPTEHDHVVAQRNIARPLLIGDRCSVGPFTAHGGTSLSPSSVAVSVAASTVMAGRNTEVSEDLSPFSLGLRGNMFRGDEVVGGRSSQANTPLPLGGGNDGFSTNAGGRSSSTGVDGSPSSRYNPTTLFVGGNALLADPHEDASIFRMPTIPHIARMRRQYHPYEETFRSLNHILSDTVSHEYLFLLDFFGAESGQMCVDIFRKTLQNSIDHVSDKILMNTPRADLLQQQNGAGGGGGASSHAASSLNTAFSPFISGNRDLGGLLILFRMTLIFKTQMLHVRQLHILEPFYHSILTLLWPAIHAALEDHNRSLRACASLASDRIASVMGTRGHGKRHGVGSSHVSNAFVPPPPDPTMVAIVHPIALRYAELSTMVLQLTDLAFIPHYKHLRRQEVLGRAGERSGGGAKGQNSSAQTPTSTSSNAFSALALGVGVDDEEETEIGSWLTVLRSNLSIMRIEVCRILSLHSKVYADTCNDMLRKKLADEYANASHHNVAAIKPSSIKVNPTAQPEERIWMGACAPTLNSIHHIIMVWESRLLSHAQRAVQRSASPSSNVAVASPNPHHPHLPTSYREGAGPLYDLSVSLPTGLRREWERSHLSLNTTQNASHVNSALTSPTHHQPPSQYREQQTLPAMQRSGSSSSADGALGRSFPSPTDRNVGGGAHRLSPAESIMSFNLQTNGDYIALKRQLESHIAQTARIAVSLACPALNHLSTLVTTFEDEALADDLLLLAIQYDEDDVAAIVATAKGDEEEGAAEKPVSAKLAFNGGSEAGEDEYAGEEEEDTTPISTRIARLVKYSTVILTRCAHFASNWTSDVQSLRRIVCTYILQPDLQQLVLNKACQYLIAANGQLHDQLTAAVDIATKIHARQQQLGEAFEYPPAPSTPSTVFLPLPPAVTTVKGLVVPNQQLLDHLRTFVQIGHHHDAHPDL